MAASARTVKHVCNVLENEIGLDKAVHIARLLVPIDGNQSYKLTATMIFQELMRRQKR